MPKNFKAWPMDWPKSLNYPEIPVHEFLYQTAARVPNRIAIIFGGMELTYAELKELSDRFASALDDMGVRKGDRVAIHLPNMPQFAIAYYGTVRIGAVFTPLSPLLSPREALQQLKDSGAETLISLDFLFPGIQSIIPETSIKRVIITGFADCYSAIIAPCKPSGKVSVPDTVDMAPLLSKYLPFQKEVAFNVKDDLVHLAYTGGTTGTSKGVMLTHRNVVSNTLQYGNWASGARIEMQDGVLKAIFPPGVDPAKDRIVYRDHETALVVVPWFHAMGSVGYLNGLIFSGTTMVVFPRFDPKEYLDAAVKYKATILGGAPHLYIALMNHPDFELTDLSGIKIASSGAAPLAKTVFDQLLNAFPCGLVQEGWGLTECAMGATANPPDRKALRPGSVGLPVYDTECKVIDPITGEDLDPGSQGELCIRGPQVMKGYWKNPAATEEVLKDGWLLTGDIGHEDENGYFYITDRKKDMIIYKGYNVYPRDIEEVMLEHSAVARCAVLGKPDADTGEFPVAFVELKPGARATQQEILDHTNSQIAHYKKIRDVIFIEAIPVSAVGKVLKKELRKLLT
ncbi:MAG: class I adenylate-forming enzyme family protein [Thermodesulfobacteriota bacterium]